MKKYRVWPQIICLLSMLIPESRHTVFAKTCLCLYTGYACCQRKNKFSLDSFSERKNFHFSLKPCVRTYHKASDFYFPWYVRTYLFHLEWKKLCWLASVRNADTDITSDVISSVVSFVRRGEIIAFTVVIQPVVKTFLFQFLQAVALTPVDISVVNINGTSCAVGRKLNCLSVVHKFCDVAVLLL